MSLLWFFLTECSTIFHSGPVPECSTLLQLSSVTESPSIFQLSHVMECSTSFHNFSLFSFCRYRCYCRCYRYCPYSPYYRYYRIPSILPEYSQNNPKILLEHSQNTPWIIPKIVKKNAGKPCGKINENLMKIDANSSKIKLGGVLGPLGASWGALLAPLRVLGASWARLGSVLERLGGVPVASQSPKGNPHGPQEEPKIVQKSI